MGWLIGLGVAVAIGVSGYFGVRSGLDRKAQKMAQGNDEDRQLAAELRDVSRKIDQGNSIPESAASIVISPAACALTACWITV